MRIPHRCGGVAVEHSHSFRGRMAAGAGRTDGVGIVGLGDNLNPVAHQAGAAHGYHFQAE